MGQVKKIHYGYFPTIYWTLMVNTHFQMTIHIAYDDLAKLTSPKK